MKSVRVDITVRGEPSAKDRAIIEGGAKRSPVHYMFSRTGLLETKFHSKNAQAWAVGQVRACGESERGNRR